MAVRNNNPRRSWCLTWNNYTEADHLALMTFVKDGCSSYVIGKEGKDTVTPHLQGVFVLKKSTRFSALKRIFPLLHWEPCRDLPASRTYCKKEGDYLELAPRVGQRTDLTVAVGAIQKHDTWLEVCRDPSLQNMLCKHLHWCRMTFNVRRLPVLEGLDLRRWQKTVLDRCLTVPGDREIMWVYGSGGEGKTTLARLLARNHEAFMASGKSADVLYGYSDQKIVVFEYPKQSQDFVSYGAIEKIKDGCYFVGKYDSHSHVRCFNVHVLVLANFEPDREKMTNDRWSFVVNLQDNIFGS